MQPDEIKEEFSDTMLDIYYTHDISSVTFLISLEIIGVYTSLEKFKDEEINKIIYCSVFIATSLTEIFNCDLLSKNGIKSVDDSDVCCFFRKIYTHIDLLKYYREFGANRILNDIYILYGVYCFKKNIIYIQYDGITNLYQFLTLEKNELDDYNGACCHDFMVMVNDMEHSFDKKRLEIIKNKKHSIERCMDCKNQNKFYPVITCFAHKKIASGTYGTVYKTIYNGSKMAQKNFEHASSFLKEVVFLLSMKHENIVSIKGIGKKGCELYMDLMDCDLYDFAVKTKREDVILCSILYDCINAIKYIHSLGIIHRDIKPKNILIKKTEDKPIVKLCDFGICGYVVTGTEELTSGLYTFPYRPPECFDSNGYNFTADIWAFGCMVYEIFHQKLLFKYHPVLEKKIDSKKNFLSYYDYMFDNGIVNIDSFAPISIINIIRGCVTVYPGDRFSSKQILDYL